MKKVITLLVLDFVLPLVLWADFTFGDMFKDMKDAAVSMSKDIFYDSKTELSWQSRPSSKKFKWSEAKKYCTDLNTSGKSDWRLPNIDELKSLVDYNKSEPAISTTLIDIKNDNYWSSSKVIDNSFSAWTVSFFKGSDAWYYKRNAFHVLCVSGE